MSCTICDRVCGWDDIYECTNEFCKAWVCLDCGDDLYNNYKTYVNYKKKNDQSFYSEETYNKLMKYKYVDDYDDDDYDNYEDLEEDITDTIVESVVCGRCQDLEKGQLVKGQLEKVKREQIT